MTLRGLCVGLVLAGLWAAPSGAEERDERIENARKQIQATYEKAEALRRAGRVEEAEQHMRKAEAMRRKLEAHFAAQKEKPRDVAELEKILAGLEQGLAALRRLDGRAEAREHLELAIREVRREIEKRQQARHGKGSELEAQFQALRFAHAAMREAERRDAAELVERALHALELKRAGRKDEEAREIMRRAPRPEQLAEIFAAAARLYAEWGHPDRADICARWARRAKGERGGEEREAAERAVQTLRFAFHAFREAEQREPAGRMEHAIRAHELRLKGRRDEEAQQVFRTAPQREELVELLVHAGELWRGFGNADRAEACLALAREWRAASRRGEDPRRREIEERLARLERSVAEIERMLRERRR